jgi:hypothetical protein
MIGAWRAGAAAIFLGAVSITSCRPSGPQVLTVEEIVPRIDELNAQTVSAAGYLAECGGYDCILHRTKQDADEWNRAISDARAGKPLALPDYPMLGIGSGTNFDFDAKAAPFTNSYVVITGTITNECRFQGKPACTDRGPDLKPTAIRAGG